MSKNINKLLVVLAVIVFGILIYQLLQTSNQSKLSSLRPTPNIIQPGIPTKIPGLTERPTVPVTPISVYYNLNSKEKPINELFFYEVKRQMQPQDQLTSEGLYQGKVIRVDKDSNNVYLVMENYLQNGYGKTVWFVVAIADLSKTKIYKMVNSQQQLATLSDIKTNAILDINENVDYNKSFVDRIISLTITIKYTL